MKYEITKVKFIKVISETVDGQIIEQTVFIEFWDGQHIEAFVQTDECIPNSVEGKTAEAALIYSFGKIERTINGIRKFDAKNNRLIGEITSVQPEKSEKQVIFGINAGQICVNTWIDISEQNKKKFKVGDIIKIIDGRLDLFEYKLA